MRIFVAILFLAVAAGNARGHPILDLTRADAPAIVCPNNQDQCPSGDTCCPDGNNHYGCCPLEDAVCCADQQHCCPSGYTCDPTSGACMQLGSVSIPMFPKRPAEPENINCPDKSECPNGNTCCKVGSSYGCCPMSVATCCADEKHCCPNGYQCKQDKETCTKGDSVVPMFLKTVPASAPGIVTCPDGESYCEKGFCCQIKANTTKYGCCPFDKGVCCSDMVHCCPGDYQCQGDTGQCVKGRESFVFSELQSVKHTPEVVDCPDGQSACPDGNTCCKLKSGEWGCCPLPSAVCCSDGEHCCPAGYTCTGSGACTRGDSVIPMFVKQPATPKNVDCPDGRSQCPDANTCCILASGKYGCCPKPNAVCCSDHVHCCPSGYTCDVSAGTCTKGDSIVSLFIKQPAIETAPKNVDCPDGRSQCPDANTCCILASGKYGCCPKPNAVCCSDHVHCCPSGYTCDVSAGTCTKGDSIVSLFVKQPAIETAAKSVMCPDGSSMCPDGNTCCKLASGKYGCCPKPNAVCCSDHVHCCPSGYTCDVSAGTCTKGDSIVSLFVKQPALETAPKNVVCPDGQSQCADGNTCCILASGKYGCCPQPNADCCSDHVHCCPNGFTCDPSAGTCTKGGSIVSLSVKQPALESAPKNVICPDGQSQCPDGNTCCKLASNAWGCCPISNAACCSDGVHCCPNGYTCSDSGDCEKSDAAAVFLQRLSDTHLL